VLHELGADVNADASGASPLYSAALDGWVGCKKVLHELGADVNK
jgi:hypothetical protein